MDNIILKTLNYGRIKVFFTLCGENIEVKVINVLTGDSIKLFDVELENIAIELGDLESHICKVVK